MQDTTTNNKRIAKNTLMLYLRMLVMMFIGLYTGRVILNALGVSDLGLINVAGSVVGMFSFISGTLVIGTQRFITYGIGEKNLDRLKKIFSTAITIHFILAFVILILCETIGLWYVYNCLNVAPGRFNAALWCYQLSLVSFFVALIQMPFNAAIVAHEKMDAYAYMTILDALFNLLAAYLIQIVSIDRVVFYSSLIFTFKLLQTVIYNYYCRRKFEECSFKFGYDKNIFKEMISFSGWSLAGNLAAMGQGTGVNMTLNYFCGTVVNGARGIAFQANGWVTRFVDNFMMAVNPQITKSYATKDFVRMNTLVCNSASYGVFLLAVLGIPLFLEIDIVLQLWLGQIPDHTVAFMRIVMIETIFRTLGNPTITAMHATGKMKEVNLTVGGVLLLIVPISITLFLLGCSSEIVLLANVIPWIIVPFIRVHWVNVCSGRNFDEKKYMKSAFLKSIVLICIMFIPPFLIKTYVPFTSPIIEFISVCIVSVLTSSLIIFYFGLNKGMQIKLKLKAKKVLYNNILHINIEQSL